MSGPLRIDRDGAVWTLTLDRPEKRNALSADLVDALIDGVEQAGAGGAEVLVLKGEGRSFSAGFDFGNVAEQSEGDLLLRFVRIETLFKVLLGSPCVTLGLAHGKNFGAGVDLFAACRHRVAAPGATFRMPGLKFGLVLGTRRFCELVGPDQAVRILEESATFDAEKALAMGFAHRVAAPESWGEAIEAARQTAGALDAGGRTSLYAAAAADGPDRDLAMLVRSAARPGLKSRIARYLGAG